MSNISCIMLGEFEMFEMFSWLAMDGQWSAKGLKGWKWLSKLCLIIFKSRWNNLSCQPKLVQFESKIIKIIFLMILKGAEDFYFADLLL